MSKGQLSNKIYDAVVIGLGGAGSSSLYYLTQTGRKVLGIEQFNICHKNGSSHGDTRIIRQAYFEGEYYVPFVKDAYSLWDEIEKKSGEKLYHKTKGINISDKKSQLVEKCKKVSDLHGLSYEILNSKEINLRYPFFNIPEHYSGLLEEKAGALFPEKCIETYLNEASKNKADILFDSKVDKIKYDKNNDTYYITYKNVHKNDSLNTVKTKSLILSCGSWMKNILTDNFNINLPLTVDLNYVYYFKLKNQKKLDMFPLYIISNGDCELYGFPDFNNGNGYKISIYHQNMSFTDQSKVIREFSNEKYEYVKSISKNFISEMHNDNMELIKHLTCLYTSTPDKDFLIDYVPGTKENVVVVSACSGHGFKFMSRVGDHAVKLLDKKEQVFPKFKIDRLLKH
jgi:monomeric sarcosine oxidase